MSTRQRKNWTPAQIDQLKKLAAQVPYVEVARRIGRTEAQVFRKMRCLGLRNIAIEARLVNARVLTKILRKSQEATLWQWRKRGLKCRLLGGLSERVEGGRRQVVRCKGSYFYALPDVIAFIKSRPGLLLGLHPAARRLLKIELPAMEPKEPSPSRRPEYRRVHYYKPVPKRPCDVCGRGMIASLCRYGVCRKTSACRKEYQRRTATAQTILNKEAA